MLLCLWDFPGKTTEWIAISFSRGIFPTQGPNFHPCIDRQILYHWATWKVQLIPYFLKNICLSLSLELLEHEKNMKQFYMFFFVVCLFVCLTFISEGCNDLLPLSNGYFWALICSLVPTWTLKNIRVSVYHGYSCFLKIHDSSSSWEFCSVEVLCQTYDYFTQIPSSHKQWSPEALSLFI